ncbi:MAG TPA: hypothetical protein VKA60_17870 [Blastocatellia bacterium]|nr:hypothetical protein [Blastocatellia bacterium]
MNRRDLLWIALIAASFAFGLAVSWQRWGNPLVDCGREMNQPLRLAGGEMLYSDVRHIYGPLSPYLHAWLFRIFGASLNVLYADGILTAVLILGLVYWLARQLLSPAAAAAATLSVMWLCAFKQAGNYILPYSYGALHGSALGLSTLAVLVAALRARPESESAKEAADQPSAVSGRRSAVAFALAGVFAGLATLAKTEMGLAALAAGLTAAVLVGYPNLWRGARLAVYFLLPALALTVGVYAFIVSRVGWHTLSAESWLFLRNLAPELVYFNKRVSGFDRPVESLLQMLGAALKLAALAGMIAAISWLITRLRRGSQASGVSLPEVRVTDTGRANPSQVWALLAATAVLVLLLPVAANLDWDKGPYLAMPLLLAIVLVVLLVRFQKAATTASVSNRTIILIVCAVYALASLARVILRVRSGGAYSSYLMPASVIMFTYIWMQPFAAIFKDRRARQLARHLVLGLMLADIAATAGLLAYRFRTRNTVPIATARGTIIAVPDIGQAWNEALGYIEQNTAPAAAIAVMPEGTSLDFFSGRRNPLREEITTPGFLDEAGEARAIRQLQGADTKLILITNRLTSEFGAAVFGRDYCQHLMQWIEANYEPCAIFGPDKNPDLQIGDRTFFIRAYRRKATQVVRLSDKKMP